MRAIVRRAPRGKYAIVSRWTPRTGQFVARLADDLGGAMFACDLADAIAREVCLTGYYEPPVTRVVQRLVSRGGTVVDAGANWGYFSLLAASAAGERGRAIALEPDPRHFTRLARNIEMNGFGTSPDLRLPQGHATASSRSPATTTRRRIAACPASRTRAALAIGSMFIPRPSIG